MRSSPSTDSGVTEREETGVATTVSEPVLGVFLSELTRCVALFPLLTILLSLRALVAECDEAFESDSVDETELSEPDV
jgi:hypothetical protein